MAKEMVKENETLEVKAKKDSIVKRGINSVKNFKANHPKFFWVAKNLGEGALVGLGAVGTVTAGILTAYGIAESKNGTKKIGRRKYHEIDMNRNTRPEIETHPPCRKI